MSKHFDISSFTNYEFVRKEAKSLLKSCRSGQPEAISRMRAALPTFAEAAEEEIREAIRLSDVQYALARESGVLNWSQLKRRIARTSDYSQAGNNGEELPQGFSPWQFSLSYTVRPSLFEILSEGREYKIFVRVIRSASREEKYRDYAELYARTTAIARGRLQQLKCPSGKVLRSRILNQGWWQGDRMIEATTVYIGMAVSCLNEDDPIPKGEDAPTPEELTRPGGMTPEKARALPPDHTVKVLDESYTDADARAGTDHQIFLVSYGEYVESCDGLNFEPFVKRAEDLARFHRSFLEGKSKIVRREWFSVTNPNIAVVHVYLRLC